MILHLGNVVNPNSIKRRIPISSPLSIFSANNFPIFVSFALRLHFPHKKWTGNPETNKSKISKKKNVQLPPQKLQNSKRIFIKIKE